MSDLRGVQNAFGSYLLSGDRAIAAAVVTTQQLDAAQRLSIYSNAYRARLSGVLASDYPVLRVIIGDDAFARLCDEYIAAHPSTSFTLRGFGRHLPEFVAAHAVLDERPFASELARFEAAFIDAFDAADAEPVGIERMGRIAAARWPAIRFAVHPSVQTIDTRFNTLRVWTAVKGAAPPVQASELTVLAGAVVWRQSLTTVFRSMESHELALWRLLGGGADFAALCAALSDWLPSDDVPVRAATLLRNWLAEGLISDLVAP
jgi:hypothetical protein